LLSKSQLCDVAVSFVICIDNFQDLNKLYNHRWLMFTYFKRNIT
jgi:hypothetical protein